MGVDVSITIAGATEWNVGHRLAEQVADYLGMYEDRDDGQWSAKRRNDPDVLELSCMTRYYGPGYERGPWPRIYAAIRGLGAMYPGAVLRYGGDGDDLENLTEVTPEFLASIWDHWLGPDGDAYHRTGSAAA